MRTSRFDSFCICSKHVLKGPPISRNSEPACQTIPDAVTRQCCASSPVGQVTVPHGASLHTVAPLQGGPTRPPHCFHALPLLAAAVGAAVVAATRQTERALGEAVCKVMGSSAGAESERSWPCSSQILS